MSSASETCWILCCQCGTPIQPNSANMCLPCIRNQVDITEGIPKQLTMYHCRGCERYLQPPDYWVTAQLESRELLGLCLKRVKGLGGQVKLVDAGFLWTEPHSKRLKLKLSVQKEVFAATVLQQAFTVEIIVCNQQCMDCARVEAKNTWKAVVQVRQKVDHKRTFLFLEQLILKQNAHRDTNNIKNVHDGLDFFYAHRNHAVRMVDFLNSVAPIRSKTSEQLVSRDTHGGQSNFKFTYSVEILPLCKDDLLYLPDKTAKSIGNISRLCLCSRVGNIVHVMDPMNLQVADLPSATFWRNPFPALYSYKDLTSFIVLDVEPTGKTVGKWAQADMEVARMSTFGKTNETFHIKSHLGRILKPGDIALGYDLSSGNFNHADMSSDAITQEAILIKKSYREARRRKGAQGEGRQWKLRFLQKEDEDEAARQEMADQLSASSQRHKRTQVHQEDSRADDLEIFMQELEEDPDLRSNIRLYKDANALQKSERDRARKGAMDIVDHEEQQMDTDNDSIPDIDIAELLDDLEIDDDDDDKEEIYGENEINT